MFMVEEEPRQFVFLIKQKTHLKKTNYISCLLEKIILLISLRYFFLVFFIVSVCVLLVAAEPKYTENDLIINYRRARFERDIESQGFAGAGNRFPGWLFG